MRIADNLLSAFYVTGIIGKCFMRAHVIPSSHRTGEEPWHREVRNLLESTQYERKGMEWPQPSDSESRFSV